MNWPFKQTRSKTDETDYRRVFADQVEKLGFELVDKKSGGHGSHTGRGYYLKRGDQTYGPFFTRSETLSSATKILDSQS